MKDDEELRYRLDKSVEECTRLRDENKRLKALIESLKGKPSQDRPLLEKLVKVFLKRSLLA